MPDLWYDVDAALAEVPVNIMPLLDDGDFKSRETTVAFDAAGMDLVWNFVTTAGAMTQTAVTPTTAGNYDWAHQGDGMYSIEIPASGGASINNDTEGFGWFTGLVTGVLPWRGPICGFRAAALNNSNVDGATIDVNVTAWLGTAAATPTTAGVPEVDVTHWLGTAAATPTVAGVPEVDMTHLVGVAQSATDLKDFADDGYDPTTNKVAGVVLTDTVTTYTGNTPQTGDSFARLGVPAGASVSADIAAIEAQTDDIGAAGAGLTAVPWNAAWDAQVESEVADALAVYDPPTHAEMTDEHGTLPTAAETAAAVWDEAQSGHVAAGSFGEVATEVAAILDDTGTTGVVLANDAITAAKIAANAIGSSEIADGAITAAKIATDAIDADALADGAITAATFAAGAIDATAIANGAIDAATFAAGAIDAAAIATGAIDADALAADAVTEIWAKAMSDISAVPGITASALDALNWMFALSRNLITQTATTQLVKKDDATTTLGTSTHSDDGVTHSRGEWS